MLPTKEEREKHFKEKKEEKEKRRLKFLEEREKHFKEKRLKKEERLKSLKSKSRNKVIWKTLLKMPGGFKVKKQ